MFLVLQNFLLQVPIHTASAAIHGYTKPRRGLFLLFQRHLYLQMGVPVMFLWDDLVRMLEFKNNLYIKVRRRDCLALSCSTSVHPKWGHIGRPQKSIVHDQELADMAQQAQEQAQDLANQAIAAAKDPETLKKLQDLQGQAQKAMEDA